MFTKNYKNLLLFCLANFWFSLITAQSVTQKEGNSTLEISLLTCESGNAIYSTFGHSAIRVINKTNRTDQVFDYGIFDFETPFFVWKFLNGSLDYELGVRPYSRFFREYQWLKRGVIEQKLTVSTEVKQQIYNDLLTNLQPANKYYKYDFLKDNCSTRIRDIFTKLIIDNQLITKEKTTYTHRSLLHHYLENKPWLKFGIDLVLGASVDQPLTVSESLFLPNTLSEKAGTFQTKHSKALLLPAQQIVPNAMANSKLPFFVQPIFVCAFLCLALFLLFKFPPSFFTQIANVFFILYGVGGLILLFLWFGTPHEATQYNFNLLWLNPLYLLLSFLKKSRTSKLLVIGLIGINLLFLLCWTFLPQQLNLACIPLVLMIIFCCYNHSLDILSEKNRRLLRQDV